MLLFALGRPSVGRFLAAGMLIGAAAVVRYNSLRRDDPGRYGRAAQIRSLVWSVVIVVVFVGASRLPVAAARQRLNGHPDPVVSLVAWRNSRTAATASRSATSAPASPLRAQRMQRKNEWVDHQLRLAMGTGEFDNLPGAGKPIKDLGAQHDPDWWIKRLVEREKITASCRPRCSCARTTPLHAGLDRHTAESEVRRVLEDFNARVMKARYTPVDGPPLITMPRDVEAEVEQWRARMQERREAARRQPAVQRAETPGPKPARKRWWRKGS